MRRTLLLLVLISTTTPVLLHRHLNLAAYYKNLINENVQKSNDYQLPTKNDAFYTKGATTEDYGTFDFVIVGAGSAGSVLAARLSEVRKWSVLVLEAGGEETEFSDIPAMSGYLQFSRMNWGYFTTPQTNSCLGMINNQCGFARGKVLGGSSAINGLQYVRGNRRDYDGWAAEGNAGWAYEEVLPYFRKAENSEVYGDPGYHGFGGPLNVAYPSPPPATLDSFLEGNLEFGQELLDYNGRRQEGAAVLQSNIRRGRRQSTGRAYLDKARRRRNLVVITEALAVKVEIDESTKTATGVVFIKNGRKYRATAKKELILSGGSINTPQLLMLSGIGPQEELQRLGIPEIADLPVGKNLRDHPFFLGLIFTTNYTAPPADSERDIHQYLRGCGPLTVAAATAGVGFSRTLRDEKGAPSIQYSYVPPSSGDSNILRVYNFNEELVSVYLSRINFATDFIITIDLLNEKSSGSVTLRSKDPQEFPNIDTNFFSDPGSDDLEAMYQGVQYVLDLVQTESFRRINATLLQFGFCAEYEEYSKEFWFCVLKHLTTHDDHPIGTTRMGQDPTMSVVDHHLRVHGFKRLRVVDAGVIPFISGNTNAPTIMMAEKMADEIKRDYNNYCHHCH